jgi:hypothetical protein
LSPQRDGRNCAALPSANETPSPCKSEKGLTLGTERFCTRATGLKTGSLSWSVSPPASAARLSRRAKGVVAL